MESNVGHKYFALRTERWSTYRIGDGEPVAEYLRRIRSELSALENASRIQWTGRRIWSSHTYPGGCWICDVIGLVHGLLGLLEESYPSVDPSSEVESEPKEEDISTG